MQEKEKVKEKDTKIAERVKQVVINWFPCQFPFPL